MTFSHGTSPASTSSRCSGCVSRATTAFTMRLIVVSWPAATISWRVLVISSVVRWSPSSDAAISALVRSSPGARRLDSHDPPEQLAQVRHHPRHLLRRRLRREELLEQGLQPRVVGRVHTHQLADHVHRQRVGELRLQVDHFALGRRREAVQHRRRQRLDARPQPLHPPHGQRLRDQGAQPAVLLAVDGQHRAARVGEPDQRPVQRDLAALPGAPAVDVLHQARIGQQLPGPRRGASPSSRPPRPAARPVPAAPPRAAPRSPRPGRRRTGRGMMAPPWSTGHCDRCCSSGCSKGGSGSERDGKLGQAAQPRGRAAGQLPRGDGEIDVGQPVEQHLDARCAR